MFEEIYFKDLAGFRKWLEQNHDKSTGIWMIYYKKHTKKECIEYSDALDEALCYGWIDSIIKRRDEETYLRKFTPRKDIKNWSEVNKTKVLKLVQEKRMTIHGLNKIESYIKEKKVEWPETEKMIDYSKLENLPEDIKNAFQENGAAWENLKKTAPSYRSAFIRWILDAKKEETKQRRIEKIINGLSNNLKPGEF